MQAEKFINQVEVQYPEEKMGKMLVDCENIAWVLTNLVSNAIRYSAENGRIIIGARKTKDNWIEMFVRVSGIQQKTGVLSSVRGKQRTTG